MDINQQFHKTLQAMQVISEEQLEDAFNQAVIQKKSLSDVLLDRNLLTPEDIGKIVAQLYNIKYVVLADMQIPQEILRIIPEVLAKKERIIAFGKDEKGLHIATSNPGNDAIFRFLLSRLGTPIIVSYATDKDIEKALSLYLGDMGKAFEQIVQQEVVNAQQKGMTVELPIIKIVDTIIEYAYKNNASDIHFEPDETTALVRFRVDGMLHDVIEIPPTIYPDIISRIKVMASLRTDEHMAPQDGKIDVTVDEKPVDIRVSVVPVKHGEKAVLRLLSERSRQISLLTLGLSQENLEKVEAAYQKPFGTILATGPTGCGKTTTMYAILKMLNNRGVNIMTIEDPIEYDVEGVNQMQVDQKVNFTFATGLRSILRQDPNIILVGEIRDDETAGIAINASLTGHLVLSTMHTNDAPTAIPRLFDMGIEPFLIASTLQVIIGQRLVRRIHPPCRVSHEVSKEDVASLGPVLLARLFGQAPTTRVYKGKGCSLCHGTGYEGRIGIFEVMQLTDEVKQAILDKKEVSIIRDIAMRNGMTTMVEDGLQKVQTGITTIEEVMRAAEE